MSVGTGVGAGAVGTLVGIPVGTVVGIAVGAAVGAAVGITGTGVAVGVIGVGVELGVAVGAAVAHRVIADCTDALALTNFPVIVFPFKAGNGEPVERMMLFKVLAENGVAHAELASAATPATYGLAIEVPL